MNSVKPAIAPPGAIDGTSSKWSQYDSDGSHAAAHDAHRASNKKVWCALADGINIVETRGPIYNSYGHSDRVWRLEVHGVPHQLTMEEAARMAVQVLPDEDIVWYVNEDDDSRGYEPWSVVPFPMGWMGGNIYYSTRAGANRRLSKRLQDKMEDELRAHERRMAKLAEYVKETV